MKTEEDIRSNGFCKVFEGNALSCHVAIDEASKVTADSETSSDGEDSTKKFSLSEKILLASLLLLCVASDAAMSIISPFFPQEAAAKNISLSMSGFVFSIYSLTVVLASPFLYNIVHLFGPKRILLIGAFAGATTNIIFGLLGNINSGNIFLVLCLIVRTLEGIAGAMFSVASYTYASVKFPNDVNTVTSLMETAGIIGQSLGPAFGGILYDVGGYGCPFYVLGGLLFCVVPINYVLLPATIQEKVAESKIDSNQISAMKLLKVGPILVIGVLLIVSGNAWSSINATLSLHLTSMFGFTPKSLGLFYFCTSVLYAFVSPIYGYVADRLKQTWIIMSLGLAGLGIGLWILGPLPILPIQNSLLSTSIGMTILVVALGATLIPSFGATIKFTAEYGYVADVKLYSILSSFSWSVYSIGGVTGPAIGAVINDNYGFAKSCALMGLLCLITAVFVFIYFIYRTVPRAQNVSTDELTPLL